MRGRGSPGPVPWENVVLPVARSTPSGSDFPIRAVLEGREERAGVREELLRRRSLVVSLGINLPGWPKSLPGDREALESAAALLTDRLGPAAEVLSLDNGAGSALLMAWDDPEMGRDRRAGEAPDLPGGLASAGMGIIPGRRFGAAVKRLTLELEEGLPFGRILDLDVWVREGPVGRGDLGLPPRRCLLCGEEAKICARLGGHSFEALRAEAARLLALTSPSTRG